MKYIDLKTLAKESSLSVYTLRKFVKKGLPHYRIGRKILVKPEDFDQWMDEYGRWQTKHQKLTPQEWIDPKFHRNILSKKSNDL